VSERAGPPCPFERTTTGWQMARLVIENRFWSGDPQVMLGA
jgi:hypothetical protein